LGGDVRDRPASKKRRSERLSSDEKQVPAYLKTVGRKLGDRVEEPEMERDGFLAVLSNKSTSDLGVSGRMEPHEVRSEAGHIHRRGEVTW